MMFCWVGFVCLCVGVVVRFLRSLMAQGGLEPSVTKAALQLSFPSSPFRCFTGVRHHVWLHGDFCQGSVESYLQLSSLCLPVPSPVRLYPISLCFYIPSACAHLYSQQGPNLPGDLALENMHCSSSKFAAVSWQFPNCGFG